MLLKKIIMIKIYLLKSLINISKFRIKSSPSSNTIVKVQKNFKKVNLCGKKDGS
jgi:hypothetical protein